ncbi:shikimate dehydrogenase [Salinicoccus sp. HZC-1]|uniref:shikimate dehydrogenase n=1 Tax=Salinicoccus sp. HZC-1 TaxID=3385497 RepID=UPI00398B0B82
MGKYAVIGHPISHTLSPLIHHANFDAKGTDDEYKALAVSPQQLEFIKDIAEKESLSGFNVTLPHKEAIMEYLDEIDEGAKNIGAVNTVAVRDDVFKGYNTDISGYMNAFTARFGHEKHNVLILGAGGAAKAVQRAHSDHGDEVTLAARREESFKRFTTGDYTPLLIDNISAEDHYDVIVNATPVGMKHEDLFEVMGIPTAIVKEDTIGMDLIYQPEWTKFLTYFSEQNAMNGLPMLVSQAMDAYTIWTGETGDHEAANKKCKEYFGGKS